VTDLRTLCYLADMSTSSARDHKKIDDAVLRTGSVYYEARNSQILDLSAPLLLLRRNFVVRCTPLYTLYKLTIRGRFDSESLRIGRRNGTREWTAGDDSGFPETDQWEISLREYLINHVYRSRLRTRRIVGLELHWNWPTGVIGWVRPETSNRIRW